MGMLYLHSDIFLTDIIGYDRLNLGRLIPQNGVRHCPVRFSSVRFVRSERSRKTHQLFMVKRTGLRLVICRTGFNGSNDPTNSVKALKEVVVLRTRLQSHQVHLTMLQ